MECNEKETDRYCVTPQQDAPDSPKDEHHGPLDSSGGRGIDREGKRQSRHLLYTTHFPLPQVFTECFVGTLIFLLLKKNLNAVPDFFCLSLFLANNWFREFPFFK